jgi:hypothetical protein
MTVPLRRVTATVARPQWRDDVLRSQFLAF